MKGLISEETDRVAAQDSGSRPQSAPAHTHSQAVWRPLRPGHDMAPRTLPSAPACEASWPPARKVCWKSPLSACGAQSCLESRGLRASRVRPDSGPGRAPARSPSRSLSSTSRPVSSSDGHCARAAGWGPREPKERRAPRPRGFGPTALAEAGGQGPRPVRCDASAGPAPGAAGGKRSS